MTETTTLKRLALTDIELPDFNPRQHEDSRDVKDLATSIAETGVLEPIIVRPRDGKYEIVAGSRRFRASRMAKQKDIPAIVRELTDGEARDLAVIENLQRAQLHWLDEANGFAQLLTGGMTADTLAQRVGKPRLYIYQRLALTRLIAKLQELAYKDKITVAVGLLLGRLTAKVQAAIVDELGKYDRFTASDVKDYIERYVYLDLSQAPFEMSDASLVPEAGSCGACPKRSGASPMLFPDLRSKGETCTDPICFEAKCQELIARQQEKYPNALKIAYGEVEWRRRDQLHRDGIIFQDNGYGGYYGEKDPRWRQSGAGACEFTQDAIVVAGETAHLGEHKLVCTEPACAVHGSIHGRYRAPKQPGVLNEERAQQIEALWQRRTGHACRVALHEAVRKKQETLIEQSKREESSGNTTVPLEALRFAVREAHRAIRPQQDGAKYLEALWGMAGEEETQAAHSGSYRDAVEALIDGADQDTLFRLLIDLPLADDVAGKFSHGQKIEQLATAYGVDINVVTAPVIQTWQEKKRMSYAKRDARLAKERAKAEAAQKAVAKDMRPEEKPGNPAA
jgi:ParB family transcriptional regulator, chromosome partitioning protein